MPSSVIPLVLIDAFCINGQVDNIYKLLFSLQIFSQVSLTSVLKSSIGMNLVLGVPSVAAEVAGMPLVTLIPGPGFSFKISR